MDGNTSDWAGIAPFISDAAGNHLPGSPTGTDITNVYLAKDSTYLYCRIDLGNNEPPNQSVRYRLYLPNNPGFSPPYYYISGFYDTTDTQWKTALMMYDGTKYTQIFPNDKARIGVSCIEMQIPLSRIGDPTRSYIQAKTSSSSGATTTFHDATDTLDGRFQVVQGASSRQSGVGTFTFDGSGGWTGSGTFGSNAYGTENTPVISGTYTVNSDGTVKISGAGGDLDRWQFGLQKGGKMVVGASVSDPAQGIMVLFKKGGTHGLTGRQTYGASFHKDNGGPMCVFSDSISDSAGNINSTYTQNSPSGIRSNLTISGTYTRDTDGSGTITFQQRIGIGVWSGSTSTWSYYKNIPLVYNGATRDDELFSSYVKIDNQNANRQRISFSINKPEKPLSNASLVGDFFGVGYDEDERGVRTCIFATITFDGAGGFSFSGTRNTSDKGGNQAVSESGTYSYDAATGTFLIGNTPETLVLNDEGDIAIITNISDKSYQSIGVLVKMK